MQGSAVGEAGLYLMQMIQFTQKKANLKEICLILLLVTGEEYFGILAYLV